MVVTCEPLHHGEIGANAEALTASMHKARAPPVVDPPSPGLDDAFARLTLLDPDRHIRVVIARY